MPNTRPPGLPPTPIGYELLLNVYDALLSLSIFT